MLLFLHAISFPLFVWTPEQKKETKKDTAFGILRIEYRIHKNLYLMNFLYCDGYPCSSERLQYWLGSVVVQVSFSIIKVLDEIMKQYKAPCLKWFLFLENKFLSVACISKCNLWDRYFLVIAAMTPHSLQATFNHKKICILFLSSPSLTLPIPKSKS